MDAALRKRHKYMWLVIAPVMVVLIVLASKDLSFSSNTGMLEQKSGPGKILKTVENGKIQVFLMEDSEKYLLQVTLKSPIRATSSVLVGLTDDSKKELVLGQLEGVGTYSFQVSESIEGILLKDPIKNQQILKLEF
nr:hypothetical protein [Allomuricauda sp.]